MSTTPLNQRKCVPCEGGIPPLDAASAKGYLSHLAQEWELKDGKLTRMFKFKSFKEAVAFANRVADVTETEGHHPNIHILYNKVRLDLWTHAAGGLTENDFILASKIEKL
jgi:4a-hydroxytetrahydrobiopterin dehydratase